MTTNRVCEKCGKALLLAQNGGGLFPEYWIDVETRRVGSCVTNREQHRPVTTST